MVACKFRSVAPTAYAQEPYVPGEPRHWELGQVRKAVCEHTCNWIPCGVVFVLLFMREIDFFCFYSALSMVESSARQAGYKDKAGKGRKRGVWEGNYISETSVCCGSACSRLSWWRYDCVGLFLNCRNSFPPEDSSTHPRLSRNILSQWAP